MSLTLLFDLDDTLLDTNLDAFVPAYFQALGTHLADRARPDVMARALVIGMNSMNHSDDFTRTLMEVFDADFYPKLGLQKEDLVETLDDFYDNKFSSLESHTQRRTDAASLIQWALSKGYRVAIATDPLFPRKATYHRVRWAGIPAKAAPARRAGVARRRLGARRGDGHPRPCPSGAVYRCRSS